jgi:hypothetical protein
MSAICSRCSTSSCPTTTVIDLTARWICKRRYPAGRSHMAPLLGARFSAGFITRTAGRHDRCTFAALQHVGQPSASGQNVSRSSRVTGSPQARPTVQPLLSRSNWSMCLHRAATSRPDKPSSNRAAAIARNCLGRENLGRNHLSVAVWRHNQEIGQLSCCCEQHHVGGIRVRRCSLRHSV